MTNTNDRSLIFDERRAIEMEIQSLKEQTRMDFDLYFESRKIRNEQISVLLDRLRQLDERDKELIKQQRLEQTATPEPVKTTPNSIEEWEKQKEERLRSQKESKLEGVRKNVKDNINKEKIKSKKKARKEVNMTFMRFNGDIVKILKPS